MAERRDEDRSAQIPDDIADAEAIARDLAEVDEILIGQARPDADPELSELVSAIVDQRPEPRTDWVRSLDARAADGFGARSRRRRLRPASIGNRLRAPLPVGALASLLLAVAVSLALLGEPLGEGGSSPADTAADTVDQQAGDAPAAGSSVAEPNADGPPAELREAAGAEALDSAPESEAPESEAPAQPADPEDEREPKPLVIAAIALSGGSAIALVFWLVSGLRSRPGGD